MLIPDPSVLGSVVRKRRTDLGMSQTDLAGRVGTTRQWLSRFEQSSNDVSVSIIFAILRELELELEISEAADSSQENPQFPEVLAPEDVTSTSSVSPTIPVVPVAPVMSTGPVVHPPSAVQPSVPETPVTEARTDRFSLLRSRDALAGLRPPRPVQKVSETKREAPAEPSSLTQDTKKRADAAVRMDQDIARIKKSSLFKR